MAYELILEDPYSTVVLDKGKAIILEAILSDIDSNTKDPQVKEVTTNIINMIQYGKSEWREEKK